MAESPNFLHHIGNRGREHAGDVRFFTVSRNIGVSCVRNEKYAIWPLVMAESPILLHSAAIDLYTRLWGRYHVPQNVFLVFIIFKPETKSQVFQKIKKYKNG